VLFGSRARGSERANSDFDILVIVQSDEPRFRRAAPIYAAVADLPVELDAIVFTPKEDD
jgi:predicted nucleotidyltransferase